MLAILRTHQIVEHCSLNLRSCQQFNKQQLYELSCELRYWPHGIIGHTPIFDFDEAWI